MYQFHKPPCHLFTEPLGVNRGQQIEGVLRMRGNDIQSYDVNVECRIKSPRKSQQANGGVGNGTSGTGNTSSTDCVLKAGTQLMRNTKQRAQKIQKFQDEGDDFQPVDKEQFITKSFYDEDDPTSRESLTISLKDADYRYFNSQNLYYPPNFVADAGSMKQS